MDDELPQWTPGELSSRSGVPLRTCRRWRQIGRLPTLAVLLVRVLFGGDLGLVDPAWRGWSLKAGKITSREGWSFGPGEVLSLPFLHGQVRVYQDQLRWAKQADWIDQRWTLPGEALAGPKVEEFRNRPSVRPTLTEEECAHRDRLIARRRARGR